MNCTDISTYLSTAEGGTLNFLGAPPAIALCFHATISTPSGCLRRSITQNFCAPTYFTARQSDVAHKFFFWRMWHYSNHSPNHGHVTPLSQLQRGHLYISPSLRSDFFFSRSSAALGTPPLWLSAPPLSRADRTLPRTDRWSHSSSRGHYGPPRGTRDHTRRSEGHSDGRHHRPSGRLAADDQGRELRGRSRERSALTRVRPSRRPTPSEMHDRSMRRERSRSRERSTLSRLSSRRRTHSLQHREAGHTLAYSTEQEQRSLVHSQSQTTLNASKILRNVRARVVQTHSLPMYLGPSTQGERTVANSAVLFQNHVSKILATTDDGVFALPQESPGNPVWRTRADDLTSKQREHLTDL